MLRTIALISFVLLATTLAGFAQNIQDLSDLVGKWKVDLRQSPGSAEYFQELQIIAIDTRTLTGKFYGTEVKNGKVNAEWGVVYLAFTSEDTSGIYSHFAVFKNGKIEGATHSVGRNFLQPWRAEKIPADKISKP
jgi:hypothetical protein